jgi:hypothetical protein
MKEELILAQQQSSDLVLSPVMDLARARRHLSEFQEFVKEYLQPGEDYGIIPGTPKPTLYKPGADKLCELYGLSDSYLIVSKVEDFDRGLFDYTVECVLTSRRSGMVVSSGLGCCSTWESKYRWRSASRKCPSCGKEAIIKGKEEYGGGWVCFKKKDGCGEKFKAGDKAIEGQEVGRLENPDICDQKNTVLKMAEKRAKIQATLSATRSSGIFTQDMDDLASTGGADSDRSNGMAEEEGVEIAGVITAETSDNTYYWYKLEKCVSADNPELGEVRVASVKTSDDGRLADRINWLAHLKVTPIQSLAARKAYVLLKVLKVEKPPEQPAEGQKAEGQVITMPEQSKAQEGAKAAPQQASDDKRPITKAQEIEIHQIKRKLSIPDGEYYRVLGSHGYEHAPEVARKDFKAVMDELSLYAEASV